MTRPYRKADGFLTTSQTAARLGVSPSYIIRLANEGALPCHRLPGSNADRRFKVEDVDAFYASMLNH